VIRRIQPWLPALAWATLIFVLSAQPTLPVALELGTDKIVHFLAYAVLGALLARGQTRAGMPAAGACAIGMAYGASDEWHQSFVPGRSTDFVDWTADALGVVAGVTLYHWLRRRVWRAAPPLPGARTDSTSS
jgi:VanZ family protein